jgi:hypothetical protein
MKEAGYDYNNIKNTMMKKVGRLKEDKKNEGQQRTL